MPKSKPNLGVFVCANFFWELRALLEEPRFSHVAPFSFPATCGQPAPYSCERFLEYLQGTEDLDGITLFHGCCLQVAPSLPMPEKVRFHTMANCFSLFLGSAQIEQLLAGGAYLVTPGWLGHWQGWMAQWRFDEKTAGEYFAEFSSRIVLLDTGVDKNVKEKLESFAAFVNIPHETIQVGLDLFRMHLEKAVGDWEIHFDRQEFLRERQELRRQNADYTMAMDLTGRLNLANNETEVIDAVIEIFQMLFAPRRILYFPSRDGKPNKPRLYPAKEAIKEIDSSPIPWAAGEKPDEMLINIQSGAESFADLYLEGIAYPQFKPHYRNVAFFLSNPVALSIQNARIKQQNNEAKSQMMIRILESYYGALSLHDLSEKLILLLMKPEYIRGCAILLSGVNGFESVASQGFLEGFLSRLLPKTDEADCIIGYQNQSILLERRADLGAQMSPRGSFWCDDAEVYLGAFEETDPLAFGAHNYALALIPLRSNCKTIGVLSLAHTKQNRFDEEAIAYYESLTAAMATIIERKQDEERIKESEMRHRALFYHSPISLWEEDFSALKLFLDERCGAHLSAKELFDNHPELVAECSKMVYIKRVNQSTIRMFKAEDERAFFEGLHKIFTSDSLEVFKQEIITLYDQKAPFFAEAIQKTLSGDPFWTSLNIVIAPGCEENWKEMFVSIIDIHERKLAEEALWRNEHYLRAIMDAQPNIVIINNGQILIDANDSFFRFFSQYKNLEDFQNEHKCICEFFEKSSRENYLLEYTDGKWWLDVIRDNPDTLYKASMSKDGKKHHFTIKVERLMLGDEAKNIATFTDITSLEESHISLEEKMFNQARLAQMGEMLTMIAHHWRQPLSVIGLTVQNLLDAYRYDDLTLESMEQENKKILKVINELSNTLTTLSSLTARQKDLKLFDISESTKKLCELSKTEIEAFFTNFIYEIESGVTLVGIAAFYTQILMHLLKNAEEAVLLKEVGDRTIKVTLSTEDNKAMLVVQDSGGGIKEEHFARLFDPFFTTKEVATKTGLGLYIAKTIVEQQFYGGIEAQNCEGGAKFTVTFPNITDNGGKK